jgi:hypothetical protein
MNKFQKEKLQEIKLSNNIAEDAVVGDIEGFGDLVEKVAKPIAKVIDHIAGTKIEQCGGCLKRKEYLNKKFPKI